MKEETTAFNIWNQRELGVELTAAQLLAGVTDGGFTYLLDHIYPFIQIVNADAEFDEELAVKLITTATGWIVHDYGEAMSTAAPHGVVGQNYDVSALSQAQTMEEVAKIISAKGWETVEIVAGSGLLQRYLWVESKRVKFTLGGYTPSSADEKCYERLFKRAQTLNISWEHDVLKREQKLVSGAE